MDSMLTEEIIKLSILILGVIISVFTGIIALQNYRENNGKLYLQAHIVLKEDIGTFLKIIVYNTGKRPVFIKYSGLEFWDSLNGVINENKEINKIINEADSLVLFEKVSFNELYKIKNAFVVDHKNKNWRIEYMDFIYDASHYDNKPTKLYLRNEKINDIKLYFLKRKYRKTILKLGRIPKQL